MANPAFRCTTYNPSAAPAATIFFISSFKTRVWYYKLAIKRLTSCGFQVYAYDYDWKPLVEAYPKQWVEFSDCINQDIAVKMAFEKSAHPERRFGIIGISIGATIALHAAKLLPDIEKIMLVTVYGSMAQHLWEHPWLQDMREKCRSLDLDAQGTYKLFGYFEPTYELSLMGDRKILLFTNKNDPVIPYQNTELLINEARKQGLRLFVKHVEALRHSVTILKVFRRPGLWISFFTSLHYPVYEGHSPNIVYLVFYYLKR